MRLKYQKQIQSANAKFARVGNTVQYLITVCAVMIKRIQNSYESQSVADGPRDGIEAKKMHVAKTELIEYILHTLPEDETVLFFKTLHEAADIKRPHHHDVSQNGYFGKYSYPADGPVQKIPFSE